MKLSKIVVTQLQRLMDTNPFRLLLVLLRSTYDQDMSSKSRGHFGCLPRKLNN